MRLRPNGWLRSRHASALLGVCLISVLFGAVSQASAAPEFGSCNPVEGTKVGKKTVYSGGYKNKGCTRASAEHKGKYEWVPGPIPTNVKLEGESSTPMTLVTAHGGKIECSSSTASVTYTGATSESLYYRLSGCVQSGTGKACTSATGEEGESGVPKEGELVSSLLSGELGFLPGGKAIGWDVKPKSSPYFMTFECGMTGLGTKYLLEGSVVDTIRKAINRMTGENTQLYQQAGGVQQPQMLSGGPTDVLTAKILTGLEVTTEAIGYEGTEEVTYLGEQEYRTKQ